MPDKHIILSVIIFCAIVSLIEAFGSSSLRIVVKVDYKPLPYGEDKATYNVGDIISLSCDGPDVKSKDKFYGVVYEKGEEDGNNFKIPKDASYESNSFSYNVKTYDFDDKYKVYCKVETWNKTINEYEFFDRSTSVTLMMKKSKETKSSRHFDKKFNVTIPEVFYSESNPMTHICNKSDYHVMVMTNGTQRYYREMKLDLTLSDTGSIMFCSTLTRRENGGIFYERIIYNQIKYTYTTKVSSEISSQGAGLSTIEIAIVVVGIIICIGLVAGMVLYKTKRNKANDVEPSPNQDTNNDNCSTQLIYAELALSQSPRCDYSKRGSNEETPYAEIGGFIGRRMPQVNEESPYAEIITRKL